MLARSAHLPELEFATGDAIITAGTAAGELWVLVSGSLTVRKDGEVVNSISRAGALVGEMAVLLGTDHAITVEAAEPSRLRVARDADAFLGEDPETMRLVAYGLAERLNRVTTYLADLKHQYGDTPGLSMVSDVLTHLSVHQDLPARSGSARDPDPEY